MITYHSGDATEPDVGGQVAIVHVCNDVGVYAKGFAAAVAKRYPRAQERYLGWANGDPGTARRFALGAIQWVGVGHDLGRSNAWWDRWVVNMVAQHGLRSKSNPHPLDLDALEVCLGQLAVEARGPIVMPEIGCGLAGGTWDEVEPVIERTLGGHDVHVYRLDPPELVGARR